MEIKKVVSNIKRRMEGTSCSRCHDAEKKIRKNEWEKEKKLETGYSFFYAAFALHYWIVSVVSKLIAYLFCAGILFDLYSS